MGNVYLNLSRIIEVFLTIWKKAVTEFRALKYR